MPIEELQSVCTFKFPAGTGTIVELLHETRVIIKETPADDFDLIRDVLPDGRTTEANLDVFDSLVTKGGDVDMN